MTSPDRRTLSQLVVVGSVALGTLLLAVPVGATTFGTPVEVSPPPGAEPSISYSGTSAVTIRRAVPQTFMVSNPGSEPFTGVFTIQLPENLRIDRRRAANPVVGRALKRYRERRQEYRDERSAENRARLRAALVHARLLRTGATVPLRVQTARPDIPGPAFQWLSTRAMRVPAGAERTIVVRLRGVTRVGAAEFRLAIGPPGKTDEYWSEVRATLNVTTGNRIRPQS